MFRIGIAVLALITFVHVFSLPGFAQVGVGLQAPLAAFGSFKMEFASVEIGMPLRTDLSKLEAFASAKLFLGQWDFKESTIQPFIGGTGQIAFANVSDLKLIGLLGLEAHIPETNFAAFFNLGISPNYATGLLESMAVGMRYSF